MTKTAATPAPAVISTASILAALDDFVETTGLSRATDHAFTWVTAILRTGDRPTYLDQYVATRDVHLPLHDYIDRAKTRLFAAQSQATAAWQAGDAEAWAGATMDAERARHIFQKLSQDRASRENAGWGFGGATLTVPQPPRVQESDRLLVTRAASLMRGRPDVPESVRPLVDALASLHDRWMKEMYTWRGIDDSDTKARLAERERRLAAVDRLLAAGGGS